MEKGDSAPESPTLRERAAKWLKLAESLPPGEEAERMRRLAIAYVELADRIEVGLARAKEARRRGEDAFKAPEA